MGADRRAGTRLDVKVGFTCNNRCSFCVQGDKRAHVADRTTAEIAAILRARRGDAYGVVFTGGEPTLRDDLPRLVRYARLLGYETVQIQTNGRRLAYAPFLKALVDAGATEVSPAIHGSTPDVHDALTRARGAWAQTVQGIRNARALGLRVLTNTVVVRGNLDDLEALAELLVSIDVQQVQLALVHPVGSPEKAFDEVVPRLADAAPRVQRALARVRAAGVRGFTEAMPYCLMRGYEDFVVERHIPDTCVVDRPVTIADYTEYRWNEGKAKGPPCASCTWSGVCEGPWREYPAAHGWDDLVPRNDPPPLER